MLEGGSFVVEQRYALEMKKVSKAFPGTLAVNQVSFSVKPGEVHALMGENGAGKSTLMKILAGSYNDYTGEILIDGKSVTLHTPSMAKSEGVEMVYQELSIAYNRSVAENMFAGMIPGKGYFTDDEKLNEMAVNALKRVGLNEEINPTVQMKTVSQHEAQLIEMAKALNNEPKILVMDEPTSALSSREVDMLFEIIAQLKREGMSIIYISHHLPEVFKVADRVTVLRDGQLIDTKEIEDVTSEELVEMMVGEKVADFYRETASHIGEVVLSVKNLTRYGFVHDISFSLNKGEILGVMGLAGAGRTELGRCLCGADHIDSGVLVLGGEEIKPKNMAQMKSKGIAYLSENRKTEGLALRLTNRVNLFSSIVDRLSEYGFYRPKKDGVAIEKDLYKALAIYPPDPDVTTSNLSGGNQQKVLLAKWLATKPKILILDEPTRGVDVGAKKLIHETIEKLAESGVSVILLSSDLPELVTLSDRVAVIKQGHMIGELRKEDHFDENKVLLAANGQRGVLSVEY